MKSIPGSTPEEFDKMSLEFMAELQERLLELNNLNVENSKEKKEILEKIKKRQSGA